MAPYWDVPPLWQGQTSAIIAGGPSLTKAQVDYLRDKSVRVTVINNSYLLAPWADILYFCDERWYEWHNGKKEFLEFGGMMVTLENLNLPSDIKKLRHGGQEGFTDKTDSVVTGWNSGYQAIHLHAHLRSPRIILLGYDMKMGPNNESHWHGGHKRQLSPGTLQNFLPRFPSLAEALKKRNIEVINCTPDSALTVFSQRKLEDVL